MPTKESFFQLKKVWRLSPAWQVVLIGLLFLATVGGYVLGSSILITVLVAPVYEEIIFRGYVLSGFLKWCGVRKSIIFSSVLFGIWHLKNLFYYDLADVVYQMIYTGLILGPVLAYFAYKTKTIWPGVAIHYAVNLGSIIFTLLSVDWRGMV